VHAPQHLPVDFCNGGAARHGAGSIIVEAERVRNGDGLGQRNVLICATLR
jgi:hypothetical protein